MKKSTIFILVFVFNTSFLCSQNLTMSQILEIKKKDLGNVEEYLTFKGWEYMEASEPTIDKRGVATFSYDKDNMSDKAQSFLTYIYDDDFGINVIILQIINREKYTEYLTAIKGYGCKMISSKVKNEDIIKIYRGATITFKVTTSITKNGFNQNSAFWMFHIYSNEDYDLSQGL